MESSGKAGADFLGFDSGGESEKEEEEKGKIPLRKKSGLPSAADLLSSSRGKPSFLKKPAWAATKAKTEAPQRKVEAPPVTKEEEEQGDDMYEFYDPATGWKNKGTTNVDDDDRGYKKAVEKPQMTHRKREGDNKAKERTKQQRLKGQSGIGSDFREWRSEEEMKMRQQFDS